MQICRHSNSCATESKVIISDDNKGPNKLTITLYTLIIVNCKYNKSKNVAIEVDVALRYRVSFYLRFTDPSIGSLASHVSDSPPLSLVLESNTLATHNVTPAVKIFKELAPAGLKELPQGRTYFVNARHIKRSISQKLLYVQSSNFKEILRLPGSFNLRPAHMIPDVSLSISYVHVFFFFF